MPMVQSRSRFAPAFRHSRVNMSIHQSLAHSDGGSGGTVETRKKVNAAPMIQNNSAPLKRLNISQMVVGKPPSSLSTASICSAGQGGQRECKPGGYLRNRAKKASRSNINELLR